MHLDLLDLLATNLSSIPTEIGRSFQEAFFMFWDTLWALVLGFALSGAVQAFVSRDAMQRTMGDHHPVAVTRATLYGMASSSCSYAASAMARSLFVRGADFIAAMVFMFASTNLVVELGIVLVVLIGWQFVAAEFIGGAIMIVLLVLLGSLWLRGRALESARVLAANTGTLHHHAVEEAILDKVGWKKRIRTAAGWSDAAGYTMSDLTMLKKEMAIGFVVAGFLTVLVPVHVWSDVFMRGHGVWTDLENAAVGPFVAIISFVCSVGNVPLAAALWRGGISFGGVVAFIFADLIALPLLLIYRKQYGAKMGLRMLGVFWLVMSVAGFLTESLFKVVGWVPTSHPGVVVGDTLGWNYTTVLDIVAIAAFGSLYWLYRHREQFGAGLGYGKDPVCGMQVETAHAPASTSYHGEHVYFCSQHCQERFNSDPSRYVTSSVTSSEDTSEQTPGNNVEPGATAVDPVCGMTVDRAHAAAHRKIDDTEFWFCSAGCADRFETSSNRSR